MSLLWATWCVLSAKADDEVFVYKSWESIFYGEADQVMTDLEMAAVSPFDMEIYSYDRSEALVLRDETVAVALGDSVWLMSPEYLNREFVGESRRITNFVPLYFTPQIAFVVYGYKTGFGAFFSSPEDYDDVEGRYYILDFANRRLTLLDHHALSDLLGDYPDLKRRYESMKRYKSDDVVEFYFMEYLKRLAEDPDSREGLRPRDMM